MMKEEGMKQELRLRLLGGCQISLDEEPVAGLFAKQEALLAYLAVSQQEHARTAVAGLLWGGKTDSDALRNLRVNLATLSPQLKSYLQIGRQTVALAENGRYWLDVEAFETYIDRSREANGRTNHALLHEAVALYRGEFMAEFDAGDAEEFEEWLAAQRLRLQSQYIQALDALVEHAIDQESYDEGIAYAQRLLAIEPWREETHQQLMWLLALDGQFSAALAQYEACLAMLAEVFAKQPTAETVRLYDDIVQQRDRQGRVPTRPLPPLPSPAAASQLLFQPPKPPDNFLGRELEIDQLWQAMSGENGRLRVVISGMGGVGKTSLVLQAAQTLGDNFPDGVLWTNAARSDPMQIAEQWAAVYGYDFSGVADLDGRAAALRQVLAEKKALLIFDDLAEAARIRPLLPTAGATVALITTRNAHLALALDAASLPLRELTPSNGLKLLTRLVGQQRVTEERQVATAVCAQLQNLPLALTIAGRYLALRPRRKLADFAERVRDQGQRLRALELDDLAVRVSFMISWQALDDTQKQIFRWLGVFNGRSFTAAACAAVADLQPYPTQDRLYALVMLSLLHEEGDNRYRQHPLLADFAREQLGDDLAPSQRMVRYFLSYADEQQRDHLALGLEWENLLAAVKQAYGQSLWQELVHLTAVLRPTWFARGGYTTAREALAWAAEAAKRLEDEPLFASILHDWGQACLEQGAYDEAKTHLDAAAHIWLEQKEELKWAATNFLLARIALDLGNFAEADNLLASCRQIQERHGDETAVAKTLYRLARAAYDQGRYAEAETLAQQASQRQQHDAPAIRTLRLLATNALEFHRDVAQAEAYCQTALKLSQAFGEKGEMALTLDLLSDIAMQRQELALAQNYAQQSLALLQEIGDRRSQAMLLHQLSRIYGRSGEHALALQHSLNSLELCRSLGDQLGMTYVLEYAGRIEATLNQKTRSHELWQEGLQIATKLELEPLIRDFRQNLQQIA
jgi:DNA-binding SARP family transcriptional activator